MSRRLLLLFFFALPGPADAADDRAAGLFAEATQLPLESQSLFVEVNGDQANLRLVQVFRNDGPALAQADLLLPLPDGASVLGFGFHQGDRFLEASLKEKSAAEGDHRAAAAAGRTTGLLVSDGRIQRFSVYPIPAGERVRTEVRLELPVVAELGRRHLALPIRTFLGRDRVQTGVLLSIASSSPIEELAASPKAKLQIVADDGAYLAAFSTKEETEISWREPGPPLALSAAAVPLAEGGFAVEARIAFNRTVAGPVAGSRERHLIVDASRSMKRRQPWVELVLERLRKLEPKGQLSVHRVAEKHTVSDSLGTDRGSDGVGFRLRPEILESTLAEIGCHSSGHDCLFIGDLSGEGLELLAQREIPMLLLADAYEERYFRPNLPRAAAVFLEGAEAEAKLLAHVDELVLPVLAVVSESVPGGRWAPKGRGARRVAAGGFLRLHGHADAVTALELGYTLQETLHHRRLEPTILPEASPEGRRLRRSYYERHLESELVRYEAAPSPEAKRQIIELSLRENIPTPFTALQVDAPKTSLFDIKPGDPLLSVSDEPGLQGVVAHFPFGESMSLVRSDDGRFLGRFLVPRGHPDRVYAIEIAKHFDDGRTKWERAFYRIDSSAPIFGLHLDTATGQLEVDTGDDIREIAAVWAESPAGRLFSFLRSGERFVHPIGPLGPTFRTHVRDRAGNLSVMKVSLRRGQTLAVEGEPTNPMRSEVNSARSVVEPVRLTGPRPGDLELEGRHLQVSIGGRRRAFDHDGEIVRSLRLSATLNLAPERFLLATDAGDLVELDCRRASASCQATRRGDFHPHPIVGLAELGGEKVFVAVRDRGLYELSRSRGAPQRVRLPTKKLTGLQAHGGSLYLGTADLGLLIQRSGTWQATRLEARRIFGLRSSESALYAMTERGDFRVTGKDRFERTATRAVPFDSESPALTSGAVLNDQLYVGGFDAGLFVFQAGVLLRVPMQGATLQSHINRIVATEDALLIASEAGVIRAEPNREGSWRVTTLLGAPAHDISTDGERIAIASAKGLFVGPVHELERWDLEVGGRAPRYSTVAWHRGALYAGGLDGLHRYEGLGLARAVAGERGLRSTWITALCSTNHGLYVGTYDEGVGLYDGERLAVVPGLSDQWVPFGAIRAHAGQIFVGGLGMNPARRSAEGRVSRLAVPTRDVNDFVFHAGHTYLLTRDGLGRLDASEVVARMR